MPLASELELPSFDHTDPQLGDERYRTAMAQLEGHDGWLAAGPFGFIVLEHEAGEFFLRTKDAVFPGLRIAELFGISDGPLHTEIVNNIININGDDHRRLRNLVNPALARRALERYRPAMKNFLEQLLAGISPDGRSEFIDAFAKPYPSLVIAELMGAPLQDAPRLHHWSAWIQRQFDPQSLLSERDLIEQAVAEFYVYEDELIARRRDQPGDDLISALIQAEAAGDRLSNDELRNLILNILVGGVDTSAEPVGARGPVARRAPGAVAGAPQRSASPRGSGDRGSASLRADHPIHRPNRDRGDRVPRRGVCARNSRAVSAWHANRSGGAPDSFDITVERPRSRVLTFGAGIHYCLGANLARLEMQEAIGFLGERIKRIELDGAPEFGTPSGIYGLESLPLRLVRCP